MQTQKAYGAIDLFKVVSAFLVIAIHTSPLSSFSADADFFLTRILARLAVPFFFMVTGQFILSDSFKDRACSSNMLPVFHYLKKILFLYGAAILLYLPLGIYAGHYREATPFSVLRMLLFDGTFYHLWYFPALLLGIVLVCLLRRVLPVKVCLFVFGFLYLLGLFGDSYWGLTACVPFLESAYTFLFKICAYTRNGLFFAPLFLSMGALAEKKPKRAGRVNSIVGFLIAFLCMSAEGFLLRHFELQRHDSMYFFLPLCLFFLYRLLLSCRMPSSKILRSVSSWMYILHPLLIVAVRGTAKLLHMQKLLIENSLVHYMVVALSSGILSFCIARVLFALQRKPYKKDRAWIELDRAALHHNVAVLRGLLPENCILMPAVKANAYGHGAVLVARELNRMGIHAFCVACISEGIELRKNGVCGDILILGYTHPKQFPLLRRYHLTQTVVDCAYAEILNQYGKKLRVHVAVDSGMHRLGERCEHIDKVCRIFEMKNLKIEGIFTHLCADDTDCPDDRTFTNSQAQAFFGVVEELKRRGFACPKMHLQSSCGVLNYPALSGDYARVGIALYGVKSNRLDYDGAQADLQPILSLKARITSVRCLEAGERAGYGLSFTAARATKLAALSVGYADGLPRALSNCGAVLINGQRAPIVGRICMDQTVVDVTDIADVHAGGIAVLIGKSKNEEISVYDLAEQSETITNEILSRMGARLCRFWK